MQAGILRALREVAVSRPTIIVWSSAVFDNYYTAMVLPSASGRISRIPPTLPQLQLLLLLLLIVQQLPLRIMASQTVHYAQHHQSGGGMLDVRADFGAKGDAVCGPGPTSAPVCTGTDDHAAFQAAVVEAHESQRPLLIPSGTYLVNSPIVMALGATPPTKCSEALSASCPRRGRRHSADGVIKCDACMMGKNQVASKAAACTASEIQVWCAAAAAAATVNSSPPAPPSQTRRAGRQPVSVGGRGRVGEENVYGPLRITGDGMHQSVIVVGARFPKGSAVMSLPNTSSHIKFSHFTVAGGKHADFGIDAPQTFERSHFDSVGVNGAAAVVTIAMIRTHALPCQKRHVMMCIQWVPCCREAYAPSLCKRHHVYTVCVLHGRVCVLQAPVSLEYALLAGLTPSRTA